MARTEAQILSDISSTNAAISTMIAGVGVLGDYKLGDKSVNRANLLIAMQNRLVALTKELSSMPKQIFGTHDIAIDSLGNDTTEYVGDEVSS